MAAPCSQRLSHSYLVPPTLEYTPSYDYQLVEGDSFYAGQYVEGEFLYSVVVAAEYTTLTYTKCRLLKKLCYQNCVQPLNHMNILHHQP